MIAQLIESLLIRVQQKVVKENIERVREEVYIKVDKVKTKLESVEEEIKKAIKKLIKLSVLKILENRILQNRFERLHQLYNLNHQEEVKTT